MGMMHILHLSDGRPGHYHLAEGVIAAIGRIADCRVTKLAIRRRGLIPGRLLRFMLDRAGLAPARVLQLGYGVDAAALGHADLVISAGGETLPANAAAARYLAAPNIFVGSLRGIGAGNFSLVVSSYARHANLPRHLATLKPSAVDPAAIGRPEEVPVFGPANPPALAGLLIGGDSGLFKYRQAEWERLLEFAREVSAAWGTRWLVSTSRRTPRAVAEAVFALARDKSVVADFLDYKLAGPGSLTKIFGRADAILCTEDSSTMISEAAWARLPVVGVAPAHHAFKPEEAEYRRLLTGNGWCRFLPIARLNVKRFGEALEEVRPLAGNPLDALAEELRQRLPELFAERD